jgi:hypothetical protein
MTHNERTARFAQISTALALQSDQELTRLVDGAEQLASGIGGTTLAFELGGHKVFAKRLRLTDLERRPENRMSTKTSSSYRRIASATSARSASASGAS